MCIHPTQNRYVAIKGVFGMNNEKNWKGNLLTRVTVIASVFVQVVWYVYRKGNNFL